ncbi:putative heterogeneous nuclear ribonucleoprotein [Dunaliella salina]|uniref:Heterogeneous nuclear ribonucleoprotein n=1 Tax=Dunaliella salina TaxID=3046 RepID=A0ABQ7FXU2_DUNSA|nr:putative heterogeneous nuclear ribonucleoprotein [Dunaliella salina]|eukprot:KAF5827170.1 putative heterogeneous nuclear ribonucleoprotein [Dunaliella salina]
MVMGDYPVSGYKRSRIDPDMYGDAYGYGMPPPLPVFPCVKLRGLPFDVTDDDIRMFLGVEPIDVVLCKRDGRLTGEAFVVLSNPMHVEMALAKNRTYLGRRYIEIYRAKKTDYYRGVCAEVMEGGMSSRGYSRGADYDGGYGGSSYSRGGPASSSGLPLDAEGSTILKLRGLPFSVSDEDICNWFNDDTTLGISPVVKDNVLVVMENGRPSGVAFVEFPTPQEATTALTKNRQTMGTRYVEIFAANRSDLERYKARGGF